MNILNFHFPGEGFHHSSLVFSGETQADAAIGANVTGYWDELIFDSLPFEDLFGNEHTTCGIEENHPVGSTLSLSGPFVRHGSLTPLLYGH